MAIRTTNTKNRTGATSTSRAATTTMAAGPEYEVIRTCANVCNETLAYCLSQGDDHVEENHIKALVDCAAICNLTADFVGRESELADRLRGVCAEASKACQESCEGFDGDETMKRCADACHECAEYCGS